MQLKKQCDNILIGYENRRKKIKKIVNSLFLFLMILTVLFPAVKVFALEDGQISFRIDANLNTTYFQYISCSKDNINWETVYNENNKTSTLTVDVSAGTLVY